MKKVVECTNCVLSTLEDPNIQFDSEGICSYCLSYKRNHKNDLVKENKQQLDGVLERIKGDVNNKKYDSILGISGGVDSTYLALIAKELGLNPLLVHFDNGWNTELAVQNIENVVKKTGFDLFTYVVNWQEFRDLQLSYIRAGVLDWEIPTDHGFFACLYREAAKRNIKYILTGHNYQTEEIMPKGMNWNKMDVANILDIHKKFGTKKLKTFPYLGFFRYNFYIRYKKIERVNLLEKVLYEKEAAKKRIIDVFDWRDYGGKHYENIFTRFYQGYILPEKFKLDKRKAHCSNLILSNQLTKEEAKKELEEPIYNKEQFEDDKEFFLKKMGLDENEFKSIMKEDPIPHTHYKSYVTGLYVTHVKVMKFIAPITQLLKRVLRVKKEK